MSDTLIPTRLYWDGRHGVAQHDGAHVTLRVNPSRVFAEIDFAPGLGVAEVREGTNARRDMSAQERIAMTRWLESFANAARRMVEP